MGGVPLGVEPVGVVWEPCDPHLALRAILSQRERICFSKLNQ